jgi:Flp pilus assembly pilin Flp
MIRAESTQDLTPNHQKEQTTMLKNFLQDETGAELAEYAVGVALLVAIALIVYKVLGNKINQANSETGSDIVSATYNP